MLRLITILLLSGIVVNAGIYQMYGLLFSILSYIFVMPIFMRLKN